MKGYKYKDTPIQNYLSQIPTSYPKYDSKYMLSASNDKYLPSEDYTKYNPLGMNSSYPMFGGILVDSAICDSFIGSNLSALARRGSCPLLCWTDSMKYLDNIFDNVRNYQLLDFDGKELPFGCIELFYDDESCEYQLSKTSSGLVLYDYNKTSLIPNSKNSDIIIVELVGGGGGGSGVYIEEIDHYFHVRGGAGGGGGGYISCLLDASKYRYNLKIGAGGLGSSNNESLDGGSTWINSTDKEIVYNALGGNHGESGNTITQKQGGTGGNVAMLSLDTPYIAASSGGTGGHSGYSISSLLQNNAQASTGKIANLWDKKNDFLFIDKGIEATEAGSSIITNSYYSGGGSGGCSSIGAGGYVKCMRRGSSYVSGGNPPGFGGGGGGGVGVIPNNATSTKDVYRADGQAGGHGHISIYYELN